MVALVKCVECRNGRHTDCIDGYTPDGETMYGGQRCYCCGYDSEQEKKQKEEWMNDD